MSGGYTLVRFTDWTVVLGGTDCSQRDQRSQSVMVWPVVHQHEVRTAVLLVIVCDGSVMGIAVASVPAGILPTGRGPAVPGTPCGCAGRVCVGAGAGSQEPSASGRHGRGCHEVSHER